MELCFSDRTHKELFRRDSSNTLSSSVHPTGVRRLLVTSLHLDVLAVHLDRWGSQEVVLLSLACAVDVDFLYLCIHGQLSHRLFCKLYGGIAVWTVFKGQNANNHRKSLPTVGPGDHLPPPADPEGIASTAEVPLRLRRHGPRAALASKLC